jgi:hypothetical protein
MPTNFPAPKRTTGAALLIARETVGAVILTVAIVLLWLGLVHIALAVAFRPGFAGRWGILGRTAVIFIQDLAPSRCMEPDLI